MTTRHVYAYEAGYQDGKKESEQRIVELEKENDQLEVALALSRGMVDMAARRESEGGRMSEHIFEYREEFNITDIARKYAERVSHVIDEQTLANVEHQLAGYGYIEVVRCRDCSWFCEGSEVHVTYDWCRNFDCETDEDGYCAWSDRRADA